MNGRIYDPLLGRFLSADVIIDGPMNLQGYNRYSYVHNNPLSKKDPTGYESEEMKKLRRFEREHEKIDRHAKPAGLLPAKGAETTFAAQLNTSESKAASPTAPAAENLSRDAPEDGNNRVLDPDRPPVADTDDSDVAQGGELRAGNEIPVPGHGTIRVVRYAAGQNETVSFGALDLDFLHSGGADDYGWIQYVTEDTFQDVKVPYLDVNASNSTRFYDNNFPFLYRESNREIPLYQGNYEMDKLPFREPGMLRFQDTPTNPLPTGGSLRFQLQLYDRRADEVIHTINWGYQMGPNGASKY